MLFFYCASEGELDRLKHEGLQGEVRLWTSLETAQSACPRRLLVVDVLALGDMPKESGKDHVIVPAVPAEAFSNLAPYYTPKPVAAAGGIVVRPGANEPDVLLIFRRGRWDLPKGKQESGEDTAACALREVREEAGVDTLRLVRPLEDTVHGYVRNGAYCVKTTHWFLMQTRQTDFAPQKEEGIEQVAWVPWTEAQNRIGYETLRRHMERVKPAVQASVNHGRSHPPA